MRVSGLLRVIGPTSAPTGRGVCSCRCWRSCRARIAAASRLLQRCREATPAVAGSPSPTASYAFPPWVFESTSGRSEAQQQRRDLYAELSVKTVHAQVLPGAEGPFLFSLVASSRVRCGSTPADRILYDHRVPSVRTGRPGIGPRSTGGLPVVSLLAAGHQLHSVGHECT